MIHVPNTTSNRSLSYRHNKDKFYQNQLQTVYDYLQNHVSTATMVSEATGIPQKCICRYKRYLEKLGLLWEVKIGYCKVTGYTASYLTTNLSIKKQSVQLSLFK